jgi:pimeloyl-ACP methyl ester carboxylesterase
MNTLFATSPDGMRIAYERCGTGPALILLHGGGGRRQEWDEAGYVKRLQDDYTVIHLDLRGHGESAMPIDPADYTIDKMMGDVLSVADACGAEHFTVWAMSYGGKIGRYLAAHSERVDKIVLMSTPLGSGMPGALRQNILDFCAHWPTILKAQREGTLDRVSLSQADENFMQQFNVPVMLAWGPAMLDWPAVEPADFRCPVLMLIGSEDQDVAESVRKYETSLKGSRVQVQILEGLSHEQVFDEIDKVFATMLAFTQT